MLLIMCHILSNVQGEKYVSRQNLHYDGGSKAEVTYSYATKLLLWKFSNYSQKNFYKAERVKVKLRKNPYEINDQNTLIMMRCLVLCVIG